MRQYGDSTLTDILNAPRMGELTSEYMSIMLQKVGKNMSGVFAPNKGIRIFSIEDLIEKHNKEVIVIEY